MEFSDLIESELSDLQKEMERNGDPMLFKRQNDVTINLQNEHTKFKNDITVA